MLRSWSRVEADGVGGGQGWAEKGKGGHTMTPTFTFIIMHSILFPCQALTHSPLFKIPCLSSLCLKHSSLYVLSWISSMSLLMAPIHPGDFPPMSSSTNFVHKLCHPRVSCCEHLCPTQAQEWE